MLTSSLFKDYFEVVLRKTRARPSKKSHIQTLADNDNNNKDKLKVIKHTSSMMTIRIIAITTITYTTRSKGKG
jgi:hypothetical protein